MRVLRRRRFTVALFVVVVVLGGLAWHHQSTLIGIGARWYLQRLAAGDGSLARQRTAVAGLHRLLLMTPPADAMVPELFALTTLLSERIANGQVSPAWGAYLYTAYVRDLLRDRPAGTPARDAAAVRVALDREVAFFAIRARPDVPGVRIADFFAGTGDSYTVEEIEQAAAEGRELPLR
jgi:hypothetical protein